MGGMVPPMCPWLSPLVPILISLAVAGCGTWPDPVDPTQDAALPGPAPRLAPLPDLLAAADPDTEALEAEAQALRARAAGLRARAAQVGATP